MSALIGLLVLFIPLLWLLLPFIAMKAAAEKHMSKTNSFVLTLLMGPFGLLVVLLWPTRQSRFRGPSADAA